MVRQIFDDTRQRFSQQKEQLWEVKETERQEKYEKALA